MHSLVIGAALLVAAPAPKESPKKESSIVGEWLGLTGMRGGQNDPPPQGATLTFTKDGNLIIYEGKGNDRDHGTYKVDTKKSPAEIDLVPGKGEKTMLGVFKIEKDILTIAISDGERPKTFESPPGSDVMVITCKRVKKD